MQFYNHNMSSVSSSELKTSNCYTTTGGEYLGKYNHTRSTREGGGMQLYTVYNFEIGGDKYESTFLEVPCKPVGLPIKEVYVVDEKTGKHTCPFCRAVEGGTQRIITHYFGCANKTGGRKNRKPTKKNRHRRRNRRSSKKNRRN
jgi:hypothetical protein